MNIPRSSYFSSTLTSLALALALATSPATAGEWSDRSVIGRWRLASVLGFADISALDENEAHRLTGKVLTIGATRMTLGKRRCGESTFHAERVNRDQDLRNNAHVRDTTLGLPAEVKVIELSCAYLYLKTRDKAVLAWEGAYFDVIRLKH